MVRFDPAVQVALFGGCWPRGHNVQHLNPGTFLQFLQGLSRTVLSRLRERSTGPNNLQRTPLLY